jgi:hypothetical protein
LAVPFSQHTHRDDAAHARRLAGGAFLVGFQGTVIVDVAEVREHESFFWGWHHSDDGGGPAKSRTGYRLRRGFDVIRAGYRRGVTTGTGSITQIDQGRISVCVVAGGR